MSYDEMGALEITGWADELESAGDEIDEALGDLELAGGTEIVGRAKKKLRRGRAKVQSLSQAMRKSRQPGVRRKPDSMYELPFPLGTVTLTKAATGKLINRSQGEAFRIERLVIDEASVVPAPWLVEVDDIKLGNISQNVSAGASLGTFFGPQAVHTPFKGGTITSGLDAETDFLNLDAVNSRVVFASFFGNTIR